MSAPAEISRAQRVAAFLLTLDREVAAGVLRHLDERALPDVAAAMTELDPRLSDPAAARTLYREIAKEAFKPKGLAAQQPEELLAALEGAVGKERARKVVAEIEERRRHEQPFGELEARAPEELARALAGESAAVQALLLAHVSPALSAELLASFDTERALEVVKRIATLVPPPYETLRRVADDLLQKLSVQKPAAPAPDAARQLKTIADMLLHAEPAVEQSVLEAIGATDQAMAAGIRESMFAWEDLADVDKRSMQKILSTVDTHTLAVALKGCSRAVEENLMANLSTRVREMVAEERELAGAVPKAEIEQARNEVLKGVRTLMDSGEFRPARGGGEELVA